MIRVNCDMCGCDIDYEVNGVNVDFNHYGVVKFKSHENDMEFQLCDKCADKIYEYIKGKKRVRKTLLDGDCKTDEAVMGMAPSVAAPLLNEGKVDITKIAESIGLVLESSMQSCLGSRK